MQLMLLTPKSRCRDYHLAEGSTVRGLADGSTVRGLADGSTVRGTELIVELLSISHHCQSVT